MQFFMVPHGTHSPKLDAKVPPTAHGKSSAPMKGIYTIQHTEQGAMHS